MTLRACVRVRVFHSVCACVSQCMCATVCGGDSVCV